MLLGSLQHTAGDTRRWNINYDRWLSNAKIEQVQVTSDSDTCTVGDITLLGNDVFFLLIGGEGNERLTVTLTMTDSLQNIKTDTIAFTCIPA